MRSKVKVSIASLLAVALTSAGCSLAFVDGPPPARARHRHVDCTTSSPLPILDLTAAVLGLVTLVAVAESPKGTFGGTTASRTAVAVGGGALAALTATSAGIGFARISECHEAKSGASGSLP